MHTVSQPGLGVRDGGTSAPLDIYTDFVSTSVVSRLKKYGLQAVAKSWLPGERVGACLRLWVEGAKSVTVIKTPTFARYGNLCTCGMVWVCPICASKVSEERRREIKQGVEAARALGLTVVLVTYTFRHKRWHQLSVMLKGFTGASRALKQGNSYKLLRRRFGIVGTIRALEVTHGDANGWHPHVHELVFMRSSDVASFREQIWQRWQVVAKRFELDVSRKAFDCQDTYAAVSNYVAKYGKDPKWGVDAEVAKAVVKRARGERLTPFGMLEKGLAGDDSYRDKFRAFCVAFKGKSQLRWSPGLRKLLLGDEQERTDEEIAAASGEDGVVLGALSLDQWQLVLGNDVRGELLHVASSGDWDAVLQFVEGLTAAVA